MNAIRFVLCIFISIGLAGCASPAPATLPASTATPPAKTAATPLEATETSRPSATSAPQATPLSTVTVPPGLIFITDSDSCKSETNTWVSGANGQPVPFTNYAWDKLSPDYQRAINDGCDKQYIIDLKTGETSAIDKDAWGFSWSVNGRYIFYEKANTDIWVLDTQTNEEQNLTNTPVRIESMPQHWKANPDTLLFYSWDTEEDCCGEGWIGHLSSIKIDGSQYSVISNSPLNGAPAISPIGPSIIYNTHNYDENGAYSIKTFFFQLGRGSQPFPFANYSLGELGDVHLLAPAWSPNGKYLAGWLSGNKNDEYFNAIAMINWETGQSKTFFHLGDLYNGPSSVDWSPDGQYVTFYTRVSDKDKYGIWVWNVEEQAPYQLVSLETEYDTCDKAWSPDSQWLALSCHDPAIEPGIWLVETGKWQLLKTNLPVEAQIQKWVDNSIFAP